MDKVATYQQYIIQLLQQYAKEPAANLKDAENQLLIAGDIINCLLSDGIRISLFSM